VTVGYQWLVGGRAVQGATSESYIPTAADLGRTLSVRVTASQFGYADGTVVVATKHRIAPGAAPRAVTRPTIAGTVGVGRPLRANPGTWSLSGLTFSHQWLRAGRAVNRTTAVTYTPSVADVGKVLSVTVTARRPGYACGAATPAPIPPVPGRLPRS
jgi:hypothetical protein